MSLFKVREFWSVECDVDEKFDQNSLEVSKLNQDSDKIIIGSHSGILRIYEPSTELDKNNILRGYKATDLLIEKIFPEPILQVSTGKLVSGSPNVHTAVLHPKSIAIYSLVSREGATDHGTQNMLKLMYEHKLQRSAANFIVGPFGGSQNRDFICVQSLDGLLTFFEQESFAFCCFLPNFLLPGPLIYERKTDSFVTVGSTWVVESFRYKRLSESGHNSQQDDSTGVKIQSDWSFNLGEAVIDLQYLMDSNKKSYVSILGERNFYCLSDGGKLKFMKKLEFSPMCFFTYALEEEENKLMTLMISSTNTLLIYQNATVKWSAQLSFSVTAVRRAFFKNVKGAIVLLSEEGKLDCCYLGTEPQLFTAPPLAYQELDFEKAEIELASLNRVIRSYYSGDTKLTNTAAERELQVSIAVNPHLEPCPMNSNLDNLPRDEPLQMCCVSIDLTPLAILEEVQISMCVQKPLRCSNEVQFYNNLTQKITLHGRVFLGESLEISSLDFSVVVSYISNLGVPRVIKKVTALPIKLIMTTCSASKENEHKITLNVNQDPVALTTLFPEYMGENYLSLASSAIGFKNLHEAGSPVTILSAKNSQRYRLQSDSFISLNIIIKQMVARLNKHFSGVADFKITYSSPLPTAQLLEYVRAHFDKRKIVNELQNKLSQLGAQFRVIQKRLISKFKDKNPTPLTNLEKLLQDTYAEIMGAASELELELGNLAKTQNELSCALQLLLNLIRIMDVNTDALPTLETAFSPAVYDLDGQNWEDTLDASLCYLLRTILSKSEKDKIKAAHSSFEEITDVSKLEKHVTQVLDRVAKAGATLETRFESEKEVGEQQSSIKRELLPIGSRIGESSSRILSARKGFLRKPPSNNTA